MERIKKRIKSNEKLYQLLKKILCLTLSIPYITQLFKPQTNTKKLMLGYSEKIDGWVTFDINPGADYIGNIKNLSLFKSNSIEVVYASHVLEHINCNEAQDALKEIYRILKPGGEVFLAVPNTASLSKLLETDLAQTAIDIIFGVNRPVADWYPQHKYGYTETLLSKILLESGFSEIQHFKPFMQDTTQFYLGDVQVSLCLKAKK